MGITRSYVCTTQATLTLLGSHVRRTSRVLLAGCWRRATLLSLLPCCRVVQSLPELEWGPEKPIPIAGAQLCPWNARRELYQHVGNFVGSVCAPVIANLVLDGLEARLRQAFPRYVWKEGTQTCPKVNLIRLADDFVITGATHELLEHEVKPLVEAFLRERGLELSQEKTVITHIADGCDFLGQHLRKYNGKLLIK